MNRIYLIGKIIYISNIKYNYTNKGLDMSVEMLISTYNKENEINIYKCILRDDSIDKYFHQLKIGKKIYIIGFAKVYLEIIEIHINDLYSLGN